MTASLRLSSLLVLGALSACGGSEQPSSSPDASWLHDPEGDPPDHLGDVGLYPGFPDTNAVDASAIAYSPGLELWSDGLGKARWLVLPEGGVVDDADRSRWSFPSKTLFFKTFYAPSGPVETRLLRNVDGTWDYATWLWNDAGSDATLVDPSAGTPVDVTIEGESFAHEVPARLDCRKCHESNASPVIGFDELRLAMPIAGATGPTQLEALHAAGVFAGSAPADPDAIAQADATTRSVIGYLHGNCAHCHNGGVGPATAFDMRHGVVLDTTIGKPTEGSGSAAGIRIVPGSPEESVLFLAFSGETDDPEVKSMPPVGVARRDHEAIELLRGWIEGLP